MTEKQKIDEREKFFKAFNDTQQEIWKEKIIHLGIYNKGGLYKTVGHGAQMHPAEKDYSSVKIEQKFRSYGIYVHLGVGKEVFRGNSGDIGRRKIRVAKRWLNPKWMASVHNTREFMAESMSKQYIAMFSDAFSDRTLRKSAENPDPASTF